MTNPSNVSRRWLLGALVAGAAGPALAGAPTVSLRPPARGATLASGARVASATVPAAAQLIDAARLGGEVSFVVADARSGQLLEAAGAERSLPPASVVKAMTALYAIETLGSGYRFATRLMATGPVQGGVVNGDLVLVGGGDPTLSSDGLATMVTALRGLGVNGVSGRFLVHGAALPSIPAIDPAQPAHVGYNPAVSGLNLNYNQVHFEWQRAQGAWRLSMEARAERSRPAVSLARMQVVQRQSPTFTFAANGPYEDWTVASAALGNGGSRLLPVRRPEAYAAEVFQTLAAAQGIRLPPAQIVTNLPAGSVIVQHDSDDLRTVSRDMLRWSTNLTAETLGLAASVARGLRPGTLAASAGAMSDWAGARFGLARPRLVDHSGLGDASRIAALDIVRALAGSEAQLRPILRNFPMRDAQNNEIRNHPIRVDAKTGTLNFVSGLGGYITAPGGREMVFAIFCADTARRDRLGPAERERPEGGREWTQRARRLQQQLIERWAAVHV
ncbi:D-alanyl-D-alanine carboxypeptidase/D-alanyl-D-alanine-endopeptidase [Plastorhodobacter daqingensis]|uniref:D-alanyl-D-alanine carboxypeptidase/D-alanyl-D-alanine-endopeptidase n=1 Tax=Plastorhodobacter daqingensis TaxID=1387281 RepID=A0ABW2UI79_9RHOB